jgi:alkane 1-monooxygenase
MSIPAAPLPLESPSSVDVLVLWARHLTALYVPAVAILFLWTGPHPWYVAPCFMLPLLLAHQIDCGGRREARQPAGRLPAWPFDGLVYALAGLQLWIVFELVRLFSVQGFFSVDMVMVFLVVGGASGFSIITAHELIHRRKQWEQGLGRLLLCTVLYEHFYTEHLRGHHVRVGRPEDPATARFGERYEAFFRRTVPAQLRSAWRLEKRRLGDPEMGLWDRRMLGHRVLHGLVLEWGIAGVVLAVYGPAAFAAFVLQAFAAVRLLEAVNYFEHWGLVRRSRTVSPADSWDTHSWFTYYGLIGLSRHADHHAYPTRPYQQLRTWDEAPLLPFGYVGMIDLVMGRNDDFRRLATLELARRQLGPFAPSDGEPPLSARFESADDESGRLELGSVAARWRALPPLARRLLLLGGVVLAATLGVHWETGGAQLGLLARAMLTGWLLGAFAIVISVARWLHERLGQQTVAWGLAFALLFALGRGTEALLDSLLR